MADSELLPCPFCGGEARTRKGLDWYVQCAECPAELGANCDGDGNPEGEYATEEQAIETWNRRAAVTDQQFAWAVHDGRAWVCVGRALESDELKPIPGFTRDSIYRDSMQEYGEWMGKATDLMRDMAEFGKDDWRYTPLASTRHEDMLKAFGERLREFGIGEES